jgi:hypothetical protein
MKTTGIIAASAIAIFLTGCSSLGGIAESTNTLSNDKILSQSAGVLGYSPSELSIVSKRTESTNTYVNLVGVKDKKEYVCIINGGNLFSLGMTNPPVCGKKGERINSNPFQR